MREKNVVLLFFAFCNTYAINVKLQGSLSLGDEVKDRLSRYLRLDSVNGRRTNQRNMPEEEDQREISQNINNFCNVNEIKFCQGNLELFLRNYITLLFRNIKKMINNSVDEFMNVDIRKPNYGYTLFVHKIKEAIKNIKKLLKTADDADMSDKNLNIRWICVVKNISAIFENISLTYVNKYLNSDINKNQGKKELIQKIVSAIAILENDYLYKLCDEHKICVSKYECTNTAHLLLTQLKSLDDPKIKEFLKYFYKALRHTSFYSILDVDTANELENVLNDMAYSANASPKHLIISIHEAVQLRLKSIEGFAQFSPKLQVQLLHVILSDIDYFYSDQHKLPFGNILSEYGKWVHLNNSLEGMNQIMKDTSIFLHSRPEQLKQKLTNEVRVLLEISLDKETS